MAKMKFSFFTHVVGAMFLIDKIQELMEYDSAGEENHLEWLNKWHVLVYEYGSLIWEIEDINGKILQKCKSIRNKCKKEWTKGVAKNFGALIKMIKPLGKLKEFFDEKDTESLPKNLYALGVLNDPTYFYNGMVTSKKVTKISCGGMFTIFISENKLFSMGDPAFGRLGRADTSSEIGEVNLQSNIIPKYISAGYSHAFVINTIGEIYGWGCTDNGRLGVCERDVTEWHRSMTRPIKIPVFEIYDSFRIPVGREIFFKTISAGSVHSSAISVDNTLYTWGSACYTGHPPITSPTGQQCLIHVWRPTILKELKSIQMRHVNCQQGGYHSLAISYRGIVWSWGHNRVGQCGRGNLHREIYDLPSLECFQTSGGDAVDARSGISWNYDEDDFAIIPGYILPVGVVPIGRIIKHIKAGWGHSAFIDVNGNLLLCGRNCSGQLGVNPLECPKNNRQHPYLMSPTVIQNLSNVKDVCLKSDATFVLDGRGILYSFGNNARPGYMSGGENNQLVLNLINSGDLHLRYTPLGRITEEMTDYRILPCAWQMVSDTFEVNRLPKLNLFGGVSIMYILV